MAANGRREGGGGEVYLLEMKVRKKLGRLFILYSDSKAKESGSPL